MVSDSEAIEVTRDHTRDESRDETRDHSRDDSTQPGPGDGEGPTVIRSGAVRPSDDAETRVVDLPRADLPRADTESTGFPLRETPQVDPYIGKVVSSRYRVLSKLGEGGMGTVYLAEHVVIERKVALKVLSDDFARKPELVARFMQEAKAASRIGHENIVDVTDFGQTEAGSVFFAMEHLQGSDLATVIRAQELMPFSRARMIIIQICNALTAAHSKGIVHRDMKPENVFLVERDGKPDFVKVLDFGIAKMSATDDTGERLTRTGMIFGTPEYMSPEQARGDRPDHRVDVYAVGCMLYEMLTGDVPFYAETFMGVLTKHMFEPPDPLVVRVPDGQFGPEVEAIVMRALAKNRDERYQSTRDLAMALSACDAQASAVSGARPMPRPRATTRAPSVVPGTMQVSSEPLGETTDFPVSPLAARPKSGAPLGLVVLGIVLFVGAIFGTVLYKRRSASVSPPRTEVTAPPPEPVVGTVPTTKSTAQVPPPAQPAEHWIKVIITNVAGEGGQLYNGPEPLGSIPGVVKMRHSDHPVHLRASWPGYKEYPFDVLPDADRTYRFKLEPLAKRGTGGMKGNVLHPSQPKNSPEVTPPAPPPPAKTGKAADLLDPFSPKQVPPNKP